MASSHRYNNTTSFTSKTIQTVPPYEINLDTSEHKVRRELWLHNKITCSNRTIFPRKRKKIASYIDSQIKSLNTMYKEDAEYIKHLKESKERLHKQIKEKQADLIIEKAYALNKNTALRSYDFNKINKDYPKKKQQEEILLPRISKRKMKERLIEESDRLFPQQYYETAKPKGNSYVRYNSTEPNDYDRDNDTKPFELKFICQPLNIHKANKQMEDRLKKHYEEYAVSNVKLKLKKHHTSTSINGILNKKFHQLNYSKTIKIKLK